MKFGDCVMRNGKEMAFRGINKCGREVWRGRESHDRTEEQKKLSRRGVSRTVRGIATNLLSGARQRSRKTGGIVTIDFEWILRRLDGGKSEMTGTPFHLPSDS